jgi:type VI secretion system secreted protein VgrG
MTSFNDFVFFIESGHELRVVEFTATTEMSSPYSVDLVVHSRDPASELTPEDLLGRRGTLRIATMAEPAVRCMHGIVLEAVRLTDADPAYRWANRPLQS